MRKTSAPKGDYFIRCVVHGQMCRKAICKRCGIHYCIEFSSSDCPRLGDALCNYHPRLRKSVGINKQ